VKFSGTVLSIDDLYRFNFVILYLYCLEVST